MPFELLAAVVGSAVQLKSPRRGCLCITSRCNKNCWYCIRNELRCPDMTPELATQVFNTWPTIQTIGISGGEPLVNGRVEEIASVCFSNVPVVDLYTNGSLACVADLPWADFRMINVSMREGNRQSAVGLEHILSVTQKTRVVVSYVVQRSEIHMIVSHAREAKKLGAKRVAFQSLLVPPQASENFQKEAIKKSDMRQVRRQIQRVRNMGLTVSQVPMPLRRVSGRGCTMAKDYVAVDGAGNISICCSGPGPRPEMGNIIDGASVWSSGPMAELRARILDTQNQPAKCLFCRNNLPLRSK